MLFTNRLLYKLNHMQWVAWVDLCADRETPVAAETIRLPICQREFQ